MLDNIALCNYEVPTPIQAYTIPAVLQGRDIIATAQTGESSKHTLESLAEILRRIRKDCCLLDSLHLQAHGQGQEACRCPS